MMVVPVWKFTSFAMWRRAGVPFRELSAFVPEQTCLRLTEIEAAQAARGLLKEELLMYLYRVVPSAAPAERQALLSLQRDIHNDREPTPRSVEIARKYLSQEQLDVLFNWLLSRQYETQAWQEARTLLDNELRIARQKLAHLALEEEFARGIQLSGAVLFQSIEAFAHALQVPSSLPRRLKKKTEETLISFLYRAALKPSPFASFTQVGIHRFSSSLAAPDQKGQVRLVRISRILLLWMENQLEQIEECRDYLPLRINNTLLYKEENIEFFARGREGAENMMGGERFILLPSSRRVQLVLEALQRGVTHRTGLVTLLEECNVSKEEAYTFIERLIEIGLIERGLGVPDQEIHYTRRIAEVLTQIPGERAQQCVNIFLLLADIEEELPHALVKRRGELFTQLERLLQQFAETLGVQELPLADARSYIYEDVGCLEPAKSYDHVVFENIKDDLILLQQLLPLFDEAVIERLGLYQYFSTLYGPDGTCEDILDFYHKFAKLDPHTVASIMKGRGSPEAAVIFELRQSFFEHLKSHLVEGEAQTTLSLEKEWVQNFVGQFPEFLYPPKSAAYRLQFIENQGVVLNGAITGYGAPYSRFCDVFERSAERNSWSLREEVEREVHRHSRVVKQMDITAVLGLNINLHPRLTSLELEYPGAKASPTTEGVLTLRDLAVHANAQQKQLSLFSKKEGAMLNMVPLNFLFPAAGPALYRFLCVFTPYVNFRGSFWDRYLAYTNGTDSERTYFPRLQLGNIVMERQSWKYWIKQLSTPDISDRDEFSVLLAASSWKNQMGWPEEGFFRITDSAKFLAGSMDWLEDVKHWILSARQARLRKPHYVNFRNPFLLRILFKQLGSLPHGLFTLQECLPTTDMYRSSGNLSGAEEFVIELNREDGE